MPNTVPSALPATAEDQNTNALNRHCSECRILVNKLWYIYKAIKKEQAIFQYTSSNFWDIMLSEKSKVEKSVLNIASYCSSKKEQAQHTFIQTCLYKKNRPENNQNSYLHRREEMVEGTGIKLDFSEYILCYRLNLGWELRIPWRTRISEKHFSTVHTLNASIDTLIKITKNTF